LMMSDDMSFRGLPFENLWMAFRPGCIVYECASNGQDSAYRLVSMTRCTCPDPFCFAQDWSLEAENIECDGENFGYVKHTLMIRKYDGYKPLISLPIMPLDYHDRRDKICGDLVTRGGKFISMIGISHWSYQGVGEALSSRRRQTWVGERDEFPLQATRFNSRVIVDFEGFYTESPTHRPSFGRDERDEDEDDHPFSFSRRGRYGRSRSSKLQSENKTIRVNAGEHLTLGEEEFMICSNRVAGFSLLSKKWAFFYINNLSTVSFNTQAFKNLVLPREIKEMVYSLVKVHATETLHFDDIIKGKGSGIIFLLHGPPGVGKTLTAESVADGTKRPLYTISSGDLGTNTNLVEERLSNALSLATRWNAVVLIDEADVFLEERRNQDLKRNGLVSGE